MINRIKEYIDNAFALTPQTKKVVDLKDELFANMCEKYNDQIKSGKTAQEAYDYVMMGMGDISELVESVKEPYPLSPASPKENRNRALSVSLAIMLYILSPMMVILFSEFFGQNAMGIIVMFMLIAAATGLLVYSFMIRPKYQKSNDTVVEEFKEWRVNSARARYAYKAFKGAFWSIVVAIYLLFSFAFGIWSYSWIIFIIAAAIENIVKGFIHLREDKNE